MAEPSEGAYALINVASQRALDVYKKSGSYTAWLMHASRSSSASQTWVLDKQDSGWQIANMLTWRCVDAADRNKWARQMSDNNTTAQRWTIATDGKTATYGGTTYNTYTIKSKTNLILLDRSDGWVEVKASDSSNYSRWILLPVEVLSQSASYKIVPAGDVTKCIEIAGGSTANSANAIRILTSCPGTPWPSQVKT